MKLTHNLATAQMEIACRQLSTPYHISGPYQSYAKRLDCLGHIIDDTGIHPDTDKLDRIREWRTPRSYNEIQ